MELALQQQQYLRQRVHPGITSFQLRVTVGDSCGTRKIATKTVSVI